MSGCERDRRRVFFGDREVQDECTVTHEPHSSEPRYGLKNEPGDSRCAYARTRALQFQILRGYGPFRNFFFLTIIEVSVICVQIIVLSGII